MQGISRNNSEASNTVEVATEKDTEKPTTPTGLKVVSKTDSSVELSWYESKDNHRVAGYEVYRNGEKIDTVTKTGYLDEGLTKGETYKYTVRAFDEWGNYSDESSAVTVKVSGPEAPRA